jgi:hypothetical protein
MKYYKITKKQAKNKRKKVSLDIILNKKPNFPRIIFWK